MFKRANRIHRSLVAHIKSIRRYSDSVNSSLKKLLETMPKDTKHIVDIQRQRLKNKERYQKYVPAKIVLHVLGSGAKGAPRALYMFTDQSKYVFNCGEGTQRLAHEHKMKLARLEHMFITYPSWENIGGLPGLALTIQDSGVPQITLHGPEGLDELFAATRRFVILKNLKVEMANCDPETVFEDNVMTVKYVPVIRRVPEPQESEELIEDSILNEKGVQNVSLTVDASTATIKRRSRSRNRRSRSGSQSSDESFDDTTDYYAYERKRFSRSRSRSNSSSVSNSRMGPPSFLHLSQEEREQNVSMAYICRLQPKPGTLSLEKCVDAGVPAGPLLGRLKAGSDVTLENGVVVRAKDVCSPDDPGPVFIVVDCPTMDFVDSLVTNKAFLKHQSTALNEDDVCRLVVHFTPKDVMNDPRYAEWMDKFSASTQHLVLNDNNTCTGSAAIHRIQYKLNLLNNDMFPLLNDTVTSVRNNSESVSVTITKKLKLDSPPHCSKEQILTFVAQNGNDKQPSNMIIQARTLCAFHLRPFKGLDRSNELVINPSEYVKEAMSVNGFAHVLEETKRLINKTQYMSPVPYPSILFLGTGSCIPNKTRNTSGILVETGEDNYILMDCGEGTFGQLVRFYGPGGVRQVLSNLKAVYISHLHADHHIGLIGLLKGWRAAMESLGKKPEPLYLLAPKQIMSWLQLYHRRFEKIVENFDLIPNGDLTYGNVKLADTLMSRLKETLNISEINTILVRHCPNAFGVSFTSNNGYKITYSGDTLPSPELVCVGMNSDILIHEATMEDELASEAVSKMHSTTSQAIEIGQNMNAKNILLTHFSQRYAKLPRFNDNFPDNVGIAFDYLQLKPGHFCVLPLLYRPLRLMFAEHYEELEHKAYKRQMKIERELGSVSQKVVAEKR